MVKTWKLSKKDIDKIRELNAQGKTDREIADELNVSQPAINYQRGRLGLPSNCDLKKASSGQVTSRFDRITYERIKERLLKDWRCAPIARDLKIPLETVNAVSDEMFAQGMLP
ncbi:MAG: hypothetical protein AYK18_17285 [Theionarchaea archaeon DG-70]|nr:MAG: hypothetical protein AYK18_17285 [Theionarchaea archaeon DG-70]